MRGQRRSRTHCLLITPSVAGLAARRRVSTRSGPDSSDLGMRGPSQSSAPTTADRHLYMSAGRNRHGANGFRPRMWARTSELAPLWTLELAPPPSDRTPTVRGSSSSSGRRRKEWDHAWSCSSRSGEIAIVRDSPTRALAVKYGVHRRAVRQALASPLPPAKRPPVWRPAPKLGAHHALIDAWLEADREAPRKQRHTARRIWQRLVEEHGAQVSERQVRRYVRSRATRARRRRRGVRAPASRGRRRGGGRLGRGVGHDRRLSA